MKSKSYYDQNYYLLTVDTKKLKRSELEEAYHQLRRNYYIKDMQLMRLRQFYTMIREYGYSILAIDRHLECEDITLEEAHEYLSDTIMAEGHVEDYDTEL